MTRSERVRIVRESKGCFCCAKLLDPSDPLVGRVVMGVSGDLWLCRDCWAERFILGMSHQRIARAMWTAAKEMYEDLDDDARRQKAAKRRR